MFASAPSCGLAVLTTPALGKLRLFWIKLLPPKKKADPPLIPPAAKSGAPPFCVLKGGARGIALPQICRFFDYHQCLQAAADLNGNCVVNIDYHGEVSMPSAPAGTRYRR